MRWTRALAAWLGLLLAACLPLSTPTPEPSEAPPSAWTPQIENFDGVPMTYVPPGCFTMGSASGEADEQPAVEQCLANGFWIDVTEVTNARYGSAGAWNGAQRPRDSVTWYEASAHCAARGGRLPSEVEWEYAARGSSSRVYPWGNHFAAENAIFDASSGGQSADVGSRPGGAAWVGALDMAGNLWEWTSSVYRFYPYNAADGRESPDETLPRSVRGGAWVSESGMLRAANRAAVSPERRDNSVGFRCVRDA
ncbi:MAG: formylglycine-generating enzyme family protein [Chloroflexi bacterium]|nr:formylglycine-generating enzyme family protein [Chloroflexota bacterium]